MRAGYVLVQWPTDRQSSRWPSLNFLPVDWEQVPNGYRYCDEDYDCRFQ
jgi:hypothetical protein